MSDLPMPRHSLRCTDQAPHPMHTWRHDTSEWWCLGTDPEAAVAAVNGMTIDGVTITFGMNAIDYNLRECKVIGVESVSHGTVWFKTTTGMFDCTRLRSTMPTREPWRS